MSKQLKEGKKESNFELFKKLGNYDPITNTTRIVNVSEFVNEYSILQFGNGGSWCRRSATKNYKLATMKVNGHINYLWDPSDDEKDKVEKDFKTNCKIEKTGFYIQYLKIFGIKSADSKRPIRTDIKEHYKKEPCCACGRTTELVCDHKNDLYNDPRVLNTKTQTLDDFQSLCNSCNLLKRQVSKDAIKSGKRYGATNIPAMKVFGIDFISGDETFIVTDINAMVGTYWYDPIAFNNGIKSKLLSQSNQQVQTTQPIEEKEIIKIEKPIKKIIIKRPTKI
jgi:hypothetical protein